MAAGERTIRIRFDGTTSGLTTAVAQARLEVKAIQKQVGDANGNLQKFSKSALGMAKNAAMVASTLANWSSGLAVVMSLAGALIAASGAAGLIPAAVLGGVAALLTLKLGADGIKAAFTALNPTLDALKSKVSSAFQQGLAPAVDNLKVAIPQLSNGFVAIARAMSGVAVQVTAWLRTAVATQQLNTIFGAMAGIVRNVGAAIAPLIAAFVRVGAVAAPILAGLTTGIGGAADRFNDFVQRAADSGNITQWIQTAVGFFQQLFGILGDIGSIIGSVFGALQDAGTGLGGVLGPVLDQIKAFVQSAQGHDAIVALAQALGQIGQTVGGVLAAALRAAAPLLPPLLSAFTQLASQVAPIVIGAIQFLAPLLLQLAQFLAQNISWLGPIIIAMTAFAAVIWLVNAALAANPITLVIIAIAALVAAVILIIQNLDFFKGIWDAVWKFCSDIISSVVGFFQSLWQGAISWLGSIVSSIGGFFSNVFGGVRSIVGSVIDWFRNAWNNSINAVRGFFQGLANFAGGIWDGITRGVKNAINAVIRVVNGAISGVNRITGVVGIPAIPNIPYLARGGTAKAGHPYLVGEQGPELFMPGRTGRVVNADTTAQAIGGGARTINLTLDLGAGIQQRMSIELDAHDRATVRALATGSGRSR